MPRAVRSEKLSENGIFNPLISTGISAAIRKRCAKFNYPGVGVDPPTDEHETVARRMHWICPSNDAHKTGSWGWADAQIPVARGVGMNSLTDALIPVAQGWGCAHPTDTHRLWYVISKFISTSRSGLDKYECNTYERDTPLRH